jgi:hypothetical protein
MGAKQKILLEVVIGEMGHSKAMPTPIVLLTVVKVR